MSKIAVLLVAVSALFVFSNVAQAQVQWTGPLTHKYVGVELADSSRASGLRVAADVCRSNNSVLCRGRCRSLRRRADLLLAP